ncbi:MAG: hypothetical protein GX823_02625 [Clostridiales bacterium]|nr:hypothetical protein [Clostridiales bacterium]
MKNALRAVLGALRTYGVGVGIFLVIVIILLSGLSSAEEASAAEQLAMLEGNVYRAIVSCYALEGSYPENLDYLIENYNVRIDESKFVVHYTIFASNIMPDVDVLVR